MHDKYSRTSLDYKMFIKKNIRMPSKNIPKRKGIWRFEIKLLTYKSRLRIKPEKESCLRTIMPID